MHRKNPNPAFGSNLEPFHGITTFMRLPASRDLKEIDVAIVGIPFDGGASYRAGTRFGPRKIRELSVLLWGFNQVLKVFPTEVLKIVDYGDVGVIPVDILATMDNITNEVKNILDEDVRVIALGGDHSITLPLLRAHNLKYGELAVVHFDSHPDTWEWEYENQPYSHGTPFSRALEENLIDTNAYIQVGIRGSTTGPDDITDAKEMGAKVMTIDQVFESGIPTVINEIHDIIGDRPLYVSLDIDAVDPAFAPGTGTPEVGGLSSYQILQLVRGLQGLNIVGFDLVEVSPPYDHGDITSILAANLAFEFMSLLAL
ncbi:MAG: agmatinase [Anaerolineae bacterium]|jgi:agmatinase/guanidinopropionase|nr:agmatinase [Anaerolineae bacterium]MBT4308866.1 agmatinase [Anaerolineae bacterium]MBT4457203.1 agmatinase [Anaerolineae bacterium]MBT4841914.1 agmatinase [Anaerolineae bacterium]MBT6062582.1 agmatinase [Anaerolineae bacterium]